ncbi:MAG: thermonuclease family protein [Rhodocyclaceae bacterium]|nr:thermonuclease family protein [Rhodocyclaceae bacterium]MDQ8000102.1 thermonuclease family protein [Pseudomonadota bacterium]
MPLAATLLLCTVLTVQDGDTLRTRCDAGRGGKQEVVTVRLHAIDAPEHGQPYGRRARQVLASLVARRPVRLACVDTDRFERRVCQVWVAPAETPDGPPTVDAGLALVAAGQAWWYRHFASAQTADERARYAAAEEDARAHRRGLWREGERATPPWQWRRTHPRHADVAAAP